MGGVVSLRTLLEHFGINPADYLDAEDRILWNGERVKKRTKPLVWLHADTQERMIEGGWRCDCGDREWIVELPDDLSWIAWNSGNPDRPGFGQGRFDTQAEAIDYVHDPRGLVLDIELREARQR